MFKILKKIRSEIIKWQTPYYHQIEPSNYCCCCGYDNQYDVHSPGDGLPDYSICDICRIEHGYEDAYFDSLQRYRLKWLSSGLPVAYPHGIPQGVESNPLLTLKNIDIDFTNQVTVEEYKKDIPNIEEILKPWIDKIRVK